MEIYLCCFALHVIVLPGEKQSADFVIARLAMTIMTLQRLIKDYVRFIILFLKRWSEPVTWIQSGGSRRLM